MKHNKWLYWSGWVTGGLCMKGLDILFGMMVLNYLSSAALRANWTLHSQLHCTLYMYYGRSL